MVSASALATQLPLLLLPGTLCDERVFAPLIERLPNRDVIIADLTGAETAPALAQKILSLSPPQFAVLGFSLGGIVALEMVAQAPQRILGLGLIDTTARPDPDANADLRRAAVEKAQREGVASYILDAWPTLVSPRNRNDSELKALLVGMAERVGSHVFAMQTEVAINRVDSRPRLPRISVPTLVLHGADEQVCRGEVQDEMAQLIPGAVHASVAGAGHFAVLEQPDEVARYVAEWLAVLPDSTNADWSMPERADRRTHD